MKNTTIPQFRQKVLRHYKKEGRHTLPWRKTRNAYRILVSEIMLQQTQVDRVIPKYNAFISRFPTVRVLARAPLADVLTYWSGLGYNRRAIYLKRLAEAVVRDYNGVIPLDITTLQSLPGIGPYTARAVATFSKDVPYIFIETNIRSVFIHEFFPHTKKVEDKDLVPYIEKALLKKSPREWYWALMDYGSYLKKTKKNPSRTSASYTKQSTFKGSVREVRGALLKYCTSGGTRDLQQFYKNNPSFERERVQKALTGLVKEKILDSDLERYVKIM